MTFGEAIAELKLGHHVTRSGWNGRNMFLGLQLPGDGPMTVPFIFMCTVQGDFVPWLASQTDMLAEDWGPMP